MRGLRACDHHSQGKIKSMSPCDYKKYPSDWKKIREAIMERCKGFCEYENLEWNPHKGIYEIFKCWSLHGALIPWNKNGSRVVITIAHLNHDATDNRRMNLRALCQKHHNQWDAKHRAENRKRKRVDQSSQPCVGVNCK